MAYSFHMVHCQICKKDDLSDAGVHPQFLAPSGGLAKLRRLARTARLNLVHGGCVSFKGAATEVHPVSRVGNRV